TGLMSGYRFSHSAEGLVVTDTLGGEGSDTLVGIETLSFSDGNVQVTRIDNQFTLSGDSLFASTTISGGGSFALAGTGLAVTAASASAMEGNSGDTALTFTVTRSGETSGETSVDYAVTGSGANAADAADFGGVLPTGTVNFAAGETTRTITVNATGDAIGENNEGFTVALSNASSGTGITTAAASGLINNDDITATDGTYEVGENIDITVPYSDVVTVNTNGGTPTLTLSNGATATYLSGSGTTNLVYRYTVTPEDLASSDLNVSSLSLNGGTITGSSGISGVSKYAGSDLTTNDAWRSTSVFKALDADGDNVYGSDGYNLFNQSSSLPTYIASLSNSAGGSYGPAGNYVAMDDPSQPTGETVSNVSTGTWYRNGSGNLLTVTVGSSTSFRMGLIQDNHDFAAISPTQIRVLQTVGGSWDSGLIDTTADRDMDADYYFFDITDAQAGDTFVIYGTGDAAFGSNGFGGITFDTITPFAPEISGDLGSIVVAGLRVTNFSGPMSNYRLSVSAPGLVVTDFVGNEGSITLAAIDKLSFADGDIRTAVADGQYVLSGGPISNPITINEQSGFVAFGDPGGETLASPTFINNVTDTIQGGAGDGDSISFQATPTGSGVAVDLDAAASGGLVNYTNENGTVDHLLGFENVTGSNGNDTISGDAGNNTLSGADGDDRIIGGAGIDFLTGGLGKDTFVFNLETDTTTSDLGTPDVITDFDAANADIIEFANLTQFTFVGNETASFMDYTISGASGRYNAQTRMLEINSDTDADIDVEIQLQNVVAENLDDSDFIASANM
ncbi:MAG: hypothetical protein HOJ87_07875, partial [Rhodospirillaceae bacterium]|nr:hypothetical protein [Rhodospirillaceae bacterium]